MNQRPRLHLLVAILSVASATLHAQDAWDKADRETRRLAPAMLAALPRPVRADLERRGCTIPQVWYQKAPGNVISGHFRTPTAIDWAVLCSVNGVSTILVYLRGRADSVAELGSAPDKGYLQGVGDGKIGYSRAIGVVDSSFIRQHHEWYGGAEPPPLDHEGINDAFVEKASEVWYWYQGKWLRLTGAD